MNIENQKRKNFCTQLLLIASVLLLAFSTAQGALPNVVYILFDDLGIGDVSAYNSTKSTVETKAIDKLAATGFRFTNGHTGTAICSPTRYAIQTGDHAYHISKATKFESRYSQKWFPPNKRSIADLAKLAGYETGYVGKWHIGYTVYNEDGSERTGSSSAEATPEPDWSKGITDHPHSHGYDYAFGHTSSADIPPYKYFMNDTWVSNEATWITKAQAQNTGIADVPEDGTGVKTLRSGFKDPDWDFNEIQDRLADSSIAFIKLKAKKEGSPFFLFVAPSGPHTPTVPHPLDQGTTPHNYTDYVATCDRLVADIVAELKAQNVYENTIIIVTSDNGASAKHSDYSDHKASGVLNGIDIKGQKSDVYEGGHRVPLIMHWGDDTEAGSVMKPGVVSNELIALHDYFRTFAAMWEVEIQDTEGVDSWNMLPAFFGDGATQRIREANFANSIGGAYAITRQFPDGSEYKLLYTSGSGGWTDPRGDNVGFNVDFANLNLTAVQLFNLTDDIGESSNLLGDNITDAERAIAKELHDLYRGYRTSEKSNANDPDTSRGYTPLSVRVNQDKQLGSQLFQILKSGTGLSIKNNHATSSGSVITLTTPQGRLISTKVMGSGKNDQVRFDLASHSGVILVRIKGRNFDSVQKIFL